VSGSETSSYQHPEAKTPLRPEVGTQSQFRKKKPAATYRYDSSISPAMEWDGQNAARELGEWLIACIEEYARGAESKDEDTARKGGATGGATKEFKDARGEVIATVRSLTDAVTQLKRLGKPFLDWAGKAERLSFDVPTLPLFVHERLSTKAILETLKGHKKDQQLSMADLFGDPKHPVVDQVLKAYEHQDKWQNRMILGDSLVVMNSLLKYEGLGGQVQMIYIDPPYGVKFGSNFQPFVRKRDVKHNDDADMTREPEMVKAYRDTWELGLHSYLTYMRDRLLLARELLHPSGSVFVQISDENLHHVRELLAEVFGAENFCGIVTVSKTSGASSPDAKTNVIAATCDYLVWYAREFDRVKYRQMYRDKGAGDDGAGTYSWLEDVKSRSRRKMTAAERANPDAIGAGFRVFRISDMTSQTGGESTRFPISFEGQRFVPPGNRGWSTHEEGVARLKAANRLIISGVTFGYVRYMNDFPVSPIGNLWDDTGTGSFTDPKVYVVQTNAKVIQRCMLMTTDPGDLVLDPTCGSGSTAYVAEQWGRRWITCDTSRVPLALARQRLLTATFAYYELKDESRGPAGGFVYERKQNNKGEEVGGIVPHLTLRSIANDETPDEEVLVDKPEIINKTTRVTGPFVVEGTIPTPIDWDNDGETDTGKKEQEDFSSFVDRMIEVLRRSPVLHVGGNKTVNLKNVRPPAKTLSLSAEAIADDFSHAGVAPTQGSLAEEARKKAVAIVFGPESGAVSEKLVYEAAREAHAKNYAHLYVIGFQIQPNARKLVDDCEKAMGVAATYVQATMDLMMGDLLKNMRSSQIFSVCGLPDVKMKKASAEDVKKIGADPKDKDGGPWYQMELLGLDTFDPATMDVDQRPGSDVPCWMLDSNYNGLCFRATQVFFPRTGAWDDLKRSLKGDYSDSVWDHLAGTVSTPFQAGEHGQVAVKVIDDRGNELLVVKDLKGAE
jgi:adenine-specific DNA-methyltransferase